MTTTRIPRLISVVALAAGIIGAAAPAASAAAIPGQLIQLPGASGCLQAVGADGCATDAPVPTGASGMVESPDGRFVYAVGAVSDVLITYRRDSVTGALTRVNCASETGASGCTTVAQLSGSARIAMTSDGRSILVGTNGAVDRVVRFARDELTGTPFYTSCYSTGDVTCTSIDVGNSPYAVVISPGDDTVYVAGYTSDEIRWFDLDSTGTLSEPAGTHCVSESGTGGACIDGRGLNGVFELELDPSGSNLYAASYDGDAVAVFDRSAADGSLTQLAGGAGCLIGFAAVPDCTTVPAIDAATGIEVTPDGRDVFVSSYSSDAISRYARDPGTGALTFTKCISGAVLPTLPCAETWSRLDGVRDVEVSPDGRSLYAVAYNSSTFMTFAFDSGDGLDFSVPAGNTACYVNTVTISDCRDARALAQPYRTLVSADGRNVYVTGNVGDVSIWERMRTPECDPETTATMQGVAVTVTVRCSSGYGERLTFETATAPSTGTTSAWTVADDGQSASTTYTPVAGATGAVTFSYRGVSPRWGMSMPATVRVLVIPSPITVPGLGMVALNSSLRARVGERVPLRLALTRGATVRVKVYKGSTLWVTRSATLGTGLRTMRLNVRRGSRRLPAGRHRLVITGTATNGTTATVKVPLRVA